MRALHRQTWCLLLQFLRLHLPLYPINAARHVLVSSRRYHRRPRLDKCMQRLMTSIVMTNIVMILGMMTMSSNREAVAAVVVGTWRESMVVLAVKKYGAEPRETMVSVREIGTMIRQSRLRLEEALVENDTVVPAIPY